jgi:hypothetical protein
MAALPVEVLLGIYLGVLTGIIPAVVAWVLGFVFKYFTTVTVPGLAVVVLGVAIAGVSGGLLALADPTIREAPNSITLTVALLVVLMLTLYAHAKGDQMGATFPRRISLRRLANRTLSADVIDRVGGHGRVRISVAGEVGDIEGYPPLSADLRAEISDGEWTFPADLPIAELETRLTDTLRTAFDLAEVSVRIDDHGRASIDAAPPESGVSKRVPEGERAVSVSTPLPTGLARGDRVSLSLADGDVEGGVVSAGPVTDDAPTPTADGGEGDPPVRPAAPTTAGGEGRITVAVDRSKAERLLGIDRAAVLVHSRGRRHEFELLSLLRRAGKRFRRMSVSGGSDLAGATLGDARLRETHGVVALAIRSGGAWTIAPSGSTRLDSGDELLVVGDRARVDRFVEVIAP